MLVATGAGDIRGTEVGAMPWYKLHFLTLLSTSAMAYQRFARRFSHHQ
ncbi:MAG: hypothetical protein V3581_01855 [Candidatus Cardinium sp.]